MYFKVKLKNWLLFFSSLVRLHLCMFPWFYFGLCLWCLAFYWDKFHTHAFFGHWLDLLVLLFTLSLHSDEKVSVSWDMPVEVGNVLPGCYHTFPVSDASLTQRGRKRVLELCEWRPVCLPRQSKSSFQSPCVPGAVQLALYFIQT